MLFTREDISLMKSALETYNEKDQGFFNPDLQANLAKSCMLKLENYTAFTYFTKQEFTFIAVTVDHIINLMYLLPPNSRDVKTLESLESLLDRLSTLAR